MLNAYNATRIEINGLANDYFKFFGWTLPFKGKKAKLVTYLRGFKERVWVSNLLCFLLGANIFRILII